MRTSCVSSILGLLLSTNALGQGTLRGVVADSLTGEPLIGANVFLPGTSLGAVADREGVFRITGVPAGVAMLRVSYLGYVQKNIPVDVTADSTLQLDVRLSPDVLEGEEVVVRGQAKGQIAAINQQITSKTIVNVISEEKIQELPDVNAAESIGRLPGVSIIRSGGEANRVVLRGLSGKFTSVTIDGMRIASTDSNSRDLDLSTISQTSLAGIELFKALTPDKDADAIAGSINLVNRKAPAERLLRLDAKGDYNRLMDAYDQYDFSGRYGERFFDGVVGLQLSGNFERRNRSNERFNVDYPMQEDTDIPGIGNFILEFTDEIRKRHGAGLLLDINTPDSGSIRINNVFSATDRSYFLSTRNYPDATGIAVTYASRDREEEVRTFNSSIRGENYVSMFNLTWGAAFAQSDRDFPYDYAVDFIEPSVNDSNNVRISGMHPLPGPITDHPEQLIPYALNNYGRAYINNAYYRTEKNFDRERSAFLDLATDYTVGDLFSAAVKIGGKYKQRDRYKEKSELYSPYYLGYWRENTVLADGSIVPKNFHGTVFEPFFRNFISSNGAARNAYALDFLGGSSVSRHLYDLYTLSPIINRDWLRLWYELNRNGISGLGPEYSDNPAADADHYDVTENVTSAYLMNTFDVGQSLTFIAGFRVEREHNVYQSRFAPLGIGGFPVPTGVIRDTSATYSETIWLPNFHLNIRPSDFMNIRLAAYKALARPDFNFRLVRFVQLGGASAGSGNLALLLGNPGLRTAKAWNYEVNTSVFGNDIGLISVSAFYKVIDDLHHQLNRAGVVGKAMIDTLGISYPFPTSGMYLLTAPYNSFKPTKVWGMEFEHQMNFTSLPGLLKNIVLSYNASIVRSETFIVATDTFVVWRKVYVPGFDSILVPITDNETIEKKQSLEGQPEFYANISLGYDIGSFSGRISLFHQAQYNFLFSASGQSDEVIDAFTRLDLAVRYQLTGNISLMMNINNLTDAKESNSIVNRNPRFSRKLLNNGENYGPTVDLGVRFVL